MLVVSRGLDSTSIGSAGPGKFVIKRRIPGILFISLQAGSEYDNYRFPCRFNVIDNLI